MNLKITLNWAYLKTEIDYETYKAAEISITENPAVKGEAQSDNTNADEDFCRAKINAAVGNINEVMHHYFLVTQDDDVDNALEVKKMSWVINLCYYDAERRNINMDSLSQMCHRYVIAYVLAEWCKLALPSLVSGYQDRMASEIIGIEKLVNRKEAPTLLDDHDDSTLDTTIDGLSATASAVSVEPGMSASASVTVVRTESVDGAVVPSFNFSFNVPKGAKGEKGEKGDTGETGQTGPQGAAGVVDYARVETYINNQITNDYATYNEARITSLKSYIDGKIATQNTAISTQNSLIDAQNTSISAIDAKVDTLDGWLSRGEYASLSAFVQDYISQYGGNSGGGTGTATAVTHYIGTTKAQTSSATQNLTGIGTGYFGTSIVLGSGTNQVTLSVDSTTGMLHVNKGVYSDGDICAFGNGTSGSGTGTGTGTTPTTEATNVLKGIPFGSGDANKTIVWNGTEWTKVTMGSSSGSGSSSEGTDLSNYVQTSYLTDNYYTKTNVYTKSEVDGIITGMYTTDINGCLRTNDLDNKIAALNKYALKSELDSYVLTSALNTELAKYVTLATAQEIAGSKTFSNASGIKLKNGNNEVTLSVDSDGLLHVSKGMYSDGDICAFGKGTSGEDEGGQTIIYQGVTKFADLDEVKDLATPSDTKYVGWNGTSIELLDAPEATTPTTPGETGTTVSWGTSTAQYATLNVGSTTGKKLSLDGHTHSGYLATTGGNLTGNLGLVGSGTKSSELGFYSSSSTLLGSLYMDRNTKDSLKAKINSNEYTVIHSGNIGAQSVSSAENATSAEKLKTTRTIWGQEFNGTGNVDGNLNANGNIAAKGSTSSQGYFYAGDIENSTYASLCKDSLMLVKDGNPILNLNQSHLVMKGTDENARYIDFYGNSNGSATLRLIEEELGVLRIQSPQSLDPAIKIGNAYLRYDSVNNALYVEGASGAQMNFYARGGVAAYSNLRSGTGFSTLANLSITNTLTAKEVKIGSSVLLTQESGKLRTTSNIKVGSIECSTLMIGENGDTIDNLGLIEANNRTYLRFEIDGTYYDFLPALITEI